MFQTILLKLLAGIKNINGMSWYSHYISRKEVFSFFYKALFWSEVPFFASVAAPAGRKSIYVESWLFGQSFAVSAQAGPDQKLNEADIAENPFRLQALAWLII